MSRTVFVVQRRALIEGEVPRPRVDRPPFAPYVPLRLFEDRAAAQAYRDEVVRRLRRTVNPFALVGNPAELTSMKDKVFNNCLWGLNVAPPEYGDGGAMPDWRAWWAETLPGLSLEQLDGVWELFDRLRLVEVVALPLDRG